MRMDTRNKKREQIHDRRGDCVQPEKVHELPREKSEGGGDRTTEERKSEWSEQYFFFFQQKKFPENYFRGY